MEENKLSPKKIVEKIDFYLAEQLETRKSLADHVGITVGAISHWAVRDVWPSIDILYKIADFLNITVNDLIYDNNNIKEYAQKSTVLKKISVLPDNERDAILTLINSIYRNTVL